MIAYDISNLTFVDHGHIYRYDGRIVPHITGVVPSDYSHVPPKILANACRRGSEAHKVTEDYDRGILDWTRLTLEMEPYLDGWVKFLKEFDIHFEQEDIERPLYHPVYNYAGRGDRPRAWVRDVLSTIEIKTVAQMDEKVGYQTAAQQMAENYRSRLFGIPETVERWGVQLRKNGKPYPIKYEKRSDSAVFLAHLTILKEDVSLGRRTFYANAA